METLRSTEMSVTSATINNAKLRTEDSTLQKLYYDGARCNCRYFDSEYNLPFINFFQDMYWFRINILCIYCKPPL